MAAELSDRELRLLRWRAQLLAPASGESSLARAAKAAMTIQAQDVGAAALAVRARTDGLTFEQVRRQGARKSACRSWLMRNTLFLFASGDLAWMRPLLAQRPMVPALRRLSQEGVSGRKADSVLEVLSERLAAGPITRRDSIELIEAEGVQRGENNQRAYWLIHLAALRGVLVIRPALDRVQTFVAAPPESPLERDRALGRLARRYIRAYQPASVRDFAYWAKITMADARLGWERAGRLAEISTSQGVLSTLAGGLEPLDPERPLVRLLGLWDNYLLGHRDRELAVPRPAAGWVRAGGGLLKPTAFADGRAFGTWRLERDNSRITVRVDPFDRIPRGVKPGLEAEVADLGRFYGAEARLATA